MKIIELKNDMFANKILLPAIQRNFVWKPEQIEIFFDSLMREYPSGTLMFWQLNLKEKKTPFKLYKFIHNYKESESKNDVIDSNVLNKEEVFAVLDGQQRLTAMYIATTGFYTYKKYSKEHRECKLYLNLLSDKDNKDTQNLYEFKFLTDNEAKKITTAKYWYNIQNIMDWGEEEDVEDEVDNILKDIIDPDIQNKIKNAKKDINRTLRRLYKVIFEKDYPVCILGSDKDYNEVLDIFVRVNSGGTPLSKSDLLLSTIIVYWERAKNEFEEIITELNNTGRKFEFNKDVIMKACFAILDKSVVFKIENFNQSNVESVKNNWENLKKSFMDTKKLLSELGFHKENILSYNAVIPIIYYIFHANIKKSDYPKHDIKKYFALSQIRGVFGGSSDSTIDKMIKIIKKSLEDKTANPFEDIMTNQDFKQKYTFDAAAIDELFLKKKGKETGIVLTFLYQNRDYDSCLFEQDHMHPFSKFTKKELEHCNVDINLLPEWRKKRDCLPNLQLLTPDRNKKGGKYDIPLEDWLRDKNIDEENFKKTNLIDSKISLNFKNFDEFYENRKRNMITKLKKVLGIEEMITDPAREEENH